MNSPFRKRPSPGSATARVWEIADELRRRAGRMPTGRDVVDRYVAEGGNAGTGFTQFSHWKKAMGEMMRERSEGGGPMRLTVAEDGGLVIPAELRRAMRLDAPGIVTARIEDGELRLVTPRAAIERAQALVRAFDTGEGSPVDELIRERRAEAERE